MLLLARQPPELLIAISAILDDAPGLALGNVVGSNTANILMVLGIPAILATMHTSECNTRKTYNYMLAASVMFIVLAFRGVFDWVSGVVLLGALSLVLADAFRDAHRHRKAGQACIVEAEEEVEGGGTRICRGGAFAMFLGLGLIGLPLGADLLVDNASMIARTYGISDTVIGLTLVAVGDIAAGTGHNRHGCIAPPSGRGLGQCHRV